MGTTDQIEPMRAWVVAGVKPNDNQITTRVVIGTRSEAERFGSQLLWLSIAGPFEYSIGIKP
jgi:hypothetical protein